MLFKKNAIAEQNCQLFLQHVKNHIASFDQVYLQSNGVVVGREVFSCADELYKQVETFATADKSQFLENTPQNANYEEQSLTFAYNVAFDMVGSGSFHIYRGDLSEKGKWLKAFVIYCIELFYANGSLSEEDKKGTLETLESDIRNVG